MFSRVLRTQISLQCGACRVIRNDDCCIDLTECLVVERVLPDILISCQISNEAYTTKVIGQQTNSLRLNIGRLT